MGSPWLSFRGEVEDFREALEIETARQLVSHGVGLFEQKDPTAVMVGSMTKRYATEMSVKVTKEAMQLYGGYGMTKEYPPQRYLWNALVFTIGYSPTDYHKSVVADALLG